MKKTSRTFKRFAAITSASLLAACMVAPIASFAETEEVKTSITITDTQTNASKNYNAYKLLNATVNSTDDAYTYSVNTTYRAILAKIADQGELTGSETEEQLKVIDKAILDYIAGLETTTGTNTGTMRTFGDDVYKAILADNNIAPDATTDNATFSNVSQGYYLIAQETVEDVTNATSSLVIVDTAGDEELEVSVKKAYPTFDKQIGDITDESKEISATWNADDYSWSEDADHDKYKKDAVPFRLVATLPSDYDSYNHYTLSFHDDLQSEVYGTPEIKAVYILKSDGVTKTPIEGYVEDVGCGSTHSTTHGDGCDFVLTIKDLTETTAVYGDKVIVEYTAPFTDDTKLGSEGNWNTGLLEYSNNPYNSGYGKPDNTTSNTEEDSVVAFTYEVVIDKVKKDKKTPLSGAAFKLEKLGADGKYTLVKEFTVDENSTSFIFSGLDDGTYKLTETKVPEGYNGITPIEFEVKPTHENEELTDLNGTPVTGEIEFSADEDFSTLTAKVVNNSGSQLPSTGGIGTTVFYLGGGAMVAVAGIYLISKKRMKNTQE